MAPGRAARALGLDRIDLDADDIQRVRQRAQESAVAAGGFRDAIAGLEPSESLFDDALGRPSGSKPLMQLLLESRCGQWRDP